MILDPSNPSAMPPSPFWIGFDEAREAVETLVEIASEPPEERPTCVLLIGKSGMGKTSILREAQRRIQTKFAHEKYHLDRDATHNPMLRVVIPSNPTSIKINLTLLWKQGAVLSNSIHRTADLKVIDHLRKQGTRLVGIDNIHVTLKASGGARRGTLDAKRFLMSEGTTPMVLAGLDIAEEVFGEDDELAMRSIVLRLNPWEPGEPTQKIVRELARGMHLENPDHFAEPRFAKFLYEHSGGITGQFISLMRWGQKMAKREQRSLVEFRDLEKAAKMLLSR